MPTASIVISAYNAEAYIRAALESVLCQTFQDFECIVIDDGSTDKTAEIVKSFADPRIGYHTISNSGGPARPRNIGLAKAQGHYIFMFDADDIMHPQKLELSIDAFKQHPQANFLFTNYSSIDEHGSVIDDNYLRHYDSLWSLNKFSVDPGSVSFIENDVLYPSLVKVNFIGTSSVALRKAVLTPQDCFNETLKNSDDRLFWISFAKKHNGLFLNRALHSYRILNSGISKKDFIERAPSKIAALMIAREGCADKNLVDILNAQISQDYTSLAYSYWKVAEYKKQITAATQSLLFGINVKAVKLIIKGAAYAVIKSVNQFFKNRGR